MLASVCKGNAFQVMYQHDREPSLLSFQPQLTVFGKQELSGEVRPCALQKKMVLYQTFCQCYVTGNYKRLYPSFKLLTRPKVIGKCNAAKTVALMEWVTFFFFFSAIFFWTVVTLSGDLLVHFSFEGISCFFPGPGYVEKKDLILFGSVLSGLVGIVRLVF